MMYLCKHVMLKLNLPPPRASLSWGWCSSGSAQRVPGPEGSRKRGGAGSSGGAWGGQHHGGPPCWPGMWANTSTDTDTHAHISLFCIILYRYHLLLCCPCFYDYQWSTLIVLLTVTSPISFFSIWSLFIEKDESFFPLNWLFQRVAEIVEEEEHNKVNLETDHKNKVHL